MSQRNCADVKKFFFFCFGFNVAAIICVPVHSVFVTAEVRMLGDALLLAAVSILYEKID